MKYVPFTLLLVVLSVFARAQDQPSPSGAAFRYMNVWTNTAPYGLSNNGLPVVTIDSTSGSINVRVADPEPETMLHIYDPYGNLLFGRRLDAGNNIINLSGMSRKTFVFCVQSDGLPLYRMEVTRK